MAIIRYADSLEAIGDVGSTQRSIPRYEFVRQNNNILNLAPKTVQKMERLHNECRPSTKVDAFITQRLTQVMTNRWLRGIPGQGKTRGLLVVT